jgi:hypothetical protein
MIGLLRQHAGTHYTDPVISSVLSITVFVQNRKVTGRGPGKEKADDRVALGPARRRVSPSRQ